MDIAKAFLTGAILGTVFALLKLPIPAPGAIAGVAGILGITLAYLVINT